MAFGRDPYFDGWADTFQLNYRHAGFREARIAELGAIADRCDGVRCDMAMLLQPAIIQRTWGDRSRPADGSPPKDNPFWPEAIAAIKRRHPGFTFAAEVYWDMEWELQQAGFDYTYDKRLYDRLVEGAATPVREHLMADPGFQERSLRFIENHDEPRAAATFSPEMHRAAATIALLARGHAAGSRRADRRPQGPRVDARRPPPGRVAGPRSARVLRASVPGHAAPGGARRRVAAVDLPAGLGRQPDRRAVRRRVVAARRSTIADARSTTRPIRVSVTSRWDCRGSPGREIRLTDLLERRRLPAARRRSGRQGALSRHARVGAPGICAD